METLNLQGFSYDDRYGLLPHLTSAFTLSGGWILERKTLSPTMMEFRLEIQLRAIEELYSQLVATGIELTRSTHAMLTDLCTCRRHLVRTVEPSQVLSIRLELSFLEDVTLHSLLTTGNSVA